MKIAFDVGGVLSKYPEVFRSLFHALRNAPGIEVFVISDMHPPGKILDMLLLNDFGLDGHIHSADYAAHGEMCKSILCEKLGIDILIDDFPGYVAAGKHVRLLVMPEPTEPYYADSWRTDGSEGNFGRRRKTR